MFKLMNHTMRIAILVITIIAGIATTQAQVAMPTISPSATYTDSNGEEQTATSVTESAPLSVHFTSGAENTDGWTTHYEWHFYYQGQRDSPYLTRYEEDTDCTFNDSGVHLIELWATFINAGDTIQYTDEYWSQEASPISVSISESKLEFPNAFSPNGDGINDIYKAKDGYRSIIEFHATIFNRWGQKLYSWDDPAEGWDGKFHGKDVKQGVYFVLVKARGADGRRFNIKKDVNLLRGYSETTNQTN